MTDTNDTKKYDPLSLRLPPELFEQVRERAEQNERSLNKEVTFILKDFFGRQQKEEGRN